MIGDPRELRLDLPAAHSAARMASALIREFGATYGLVGDELETLLLVASELLTNAVDHGGGGAAMEAEDLEEPVRMSLAIDLFTESWEMRVADQGGGEPADLEKYLVDRGLPDLEDERGRGFFLLSSMVDRLHVQRSSDGLGLELVAARQFARSA